MLYEYALEPAILGNWKDFRYFYGRLGVHHGRLISKFPSKWKRRVFEAIDDSPINRKRIEERLINIDDRLFSFGRNFDSNADWLTNAIKQHESQPFRAIISVNGAGGSEHVLAADDVDDETPLWATETQYVVGREANVLAEFLKPIVEISSELLIIDQFLEPTDAKFQRFVRALVQRAVNGNALRRLEIHAVTKLPALGNWKYHCEKCLAPELPLGLQAEIFRWEKADVGERHHARYVMTELGGAWIDSGTDEETTGDTTNVANCGRTLYTQRLADYQVPTSPFNLVDQISITGTRK